uniref:Uncharacterized protein n=1 Tax=Oryza brachyantha TaxID=4533 RepID=J3LVB5_ORYBR
MVSVDSNRCISPSLSPERPKFTVQVLSMISPQSFSFPSNAVLLNVQSCDSKGISPERLLWETLKKLRKERLPSSTGRLPLR